MNPAKSVAYGWGALIVATGFGYYFTKQVTNARRKEKLLSKRASESPSNWEEKVARSQGSGSGSGSGAAAAGAPPPDQTSIPTTFAGGPATPTMQSAPTGVDTPNGSGSGQQHNR
ncbi:uncharacterized protein MKK02DRAFT_40151 [Dioszegia hungarica]|uniref:Uncharacterized protein n=1 Tax=Dioszegia hungarica TaxID=4972 RepID=A0AA38LZ96_9TREE|nr:uncharacterized protein MKK02DRAFT_40151 [Dioszegia hungarica]KAI9639824.1 hypothetical protein MKK02DRAFT_40151 [Dioszegia hungarica]